MLQSSLAMNARKRQKVGIIKRNEVLSFEDKAFMRSVQDLATQFEKNATIDLKI